MTKMGGYLGKINLSQWGKAGFSINWLHKPSHIHKICVQLKHHFICVKAISLKCTELLSTFCFYISFYNWKQTWKNKHENNYIYILNICLNILSYLQCTSNLIYFIKFICSLSEQTSKNYTSNMYKDHLKIIMFDFSSWVSYI